MIDIELLRNDPARVRKAVADKNGDSAMVEAFIAFDTEWRHGHHEPWSRSARSRKKCLRSVT